MRKEGHEGGGRTREERGGMGTGEKGKEGRKEGRKGAYLELVSHDLEGQAGQGLAVVWLPGHLLLRIIHRSSLNTQGTPAFSMLVSITSCEHTPYQTSLKQQQGVHGSSLL